jgi:predicted MFS family arabinose efflux permease
MALISGGLAIGIARDVRPEGSRGSGKGYVREFFSTWRNRLLLLVSLPVAFLSWGQQSLLTYFVVYMRFRGFPIIWSEILLAVLLAGSVAGRLFWVNLSERMFSRNRSRMIAVIMLIAGLLFITFSLVAWNILEAGVMAFVLGMSAIGWNSTYVTLISEIAPRDRIGLFSGVSLMMISMGTILGTPLSGTVVDVISYNAMWRLIGLFLILMSLTVALMQRYLARHISGTPNP